MQGYVGTRKCENRNFRAGEYVIYTYEKRNRQQQIPVHNKRPSPRHDIQVVLVSLDFFTTTCLSLLTSLEGSSHLFSPKRNTRCLDTSVVPSFSTTFFTSDVTDATAAPFTPF